MRIRRREDARTAPAVVFNAFRAVARLLRPEEPSVPSMRPIGALRQRPGGFPASELPAHVGTAQRVFGSSFGTKTGPAVAFGALVLALRPRRPGRVAGLRYRGAPSPTDHISGAVVKRR